MIISYSYTATTRVSISLQQREGQLPSLKKLTTFKMELEDLVLVIKTKKIVYHRMSQSPSEEVKLQKVIRLRPCTSMDLNLKMLLGWLKKDKEIYSKSFISSMSREC